MADKINMSLDDIIKLNKKGGSGGGGGRISSRSSGSSARAGGSSRPMRGRQSNFSRGGNNRSTPYTRVWKRSGWNGAKERGVVMRCYQTRLHGKWTSINDIVKWEMFVLPKFPHIFDLGVPQLWDCVHHQSHHVTAFWPALTSFKNWCPYARLLTVPFSRWPSCTVPFSSEDKHGPPTVKITERFMTEASSFVRIFTDMQRWLLWRGSWIFKMATDRSCRFLNFDI